MLARTVEEAVSSLISGIVNKRGAVEVGTAAAISNKTEAPTSAHVRTHHLNLYLMGNAHYADGGTVRDYALFYSGQPAGGIFGNFPLEALQARARIETAEAIHGYFQLPDDTQVWIREEPDEVCDRSCVGAFAFIKRACSKNPYADEPGSEIQTIYKRIIDFAKGLGRSDEIEIEYSDIDFEGKTVTVVTGIRTSKGTLDAIFKHMNKRNRNFTGKDLDF